MDIRLLKGFYVKDKFELEDVTSKNERRYAHINNMTVENTHKMVEISRNGYK